MYDEPLDILTLNETRLDDNISDKYIEISGYEARFKRRILHAPNAIQTMHNEEAYLIIYCLNCIRCTQNSTFETGLR